MAAPYQVTLAPETIAAFDAYVSDAEKAMQESWRSESGRLWSRRLPAREQKLHDGDPVVEMWSGEKPIAVKHGLIHDWIGAVFVPQVSISKTLALLQDYDNHRSIYHPQVIDSKLIKRHKDHFNVYLRLLKQKIITVVLDTEHDVQYSEVDAKCWSCVSHTTQIWEVDDPGAEDEKILPPGTGYGFLWRLYSYWLVEERAEGTEIECRAISLTRDIPLTLKLIIQPMVRTLPRESLAATLLATRNALSAAPKKGSKAV